MFHILLILSCLIACRAEFTDELQIIEKECLGEDKFNCLDGSCILHKQYCDGNADCADGSDENFCPDHPPNSHLCNVTHQFLCSDGHACIPATWVCNSVPDCTDASDEANCTAVPTNNSTSKKCENSFACGDGTCISNLWTCDGFYDCEDRSDEDIETTCRHSLEGHVRDGRSCYEFSAFGTRQYKCLDSSFCLLPGRMCDGVVDCRDKSDEGAFCEKWHTMCVNTTCPANMTRCIPEVSGARCVCTRNPSSHDYNETTKQCQDVDECLSERPNCSQRCKNFKGHFVCNCEPGYVIDEFGYLCFAEGPEAMLFYSTEKDIRYIKVSTKEEVVVATGIKKSHGVSYDGKYLYWVETAEGHQAIARAHLDSPLETKETLVSLGLYDAGDVAIDWLGGNIYFSDTSRAAIYVCKKDGSICSRVHTATLRPKFVTLDAKKGQMYWADVAGLKGGHVIMRARMDGTDHELMTASLNNFATGLALDAPNDRLYFVDKTVMVLKLDTKQIYSLFEPRFHHPYAIAVFENTVYWCDWTSNTIQTSDKIHLEGKRNVLATLHAPIYGMHIYHPVLFNRDSNPCATHKCSHLCLLTSNTTYACACPTGMQLNGTTCYNEPHYRPQYLVVGAGPSFTRIRYDTLGNPEAHATIFNIGRVQAMAYDSRRDVLYVYDGMRKCITKIEMEDFTLGITHVFAYNGLENVVDMDYDYVTDNLYVLDSGRRFLEVFSLKDGKRALLHRFPDQEIPVSFCLVQHFGRLLVAVVESEQNNEIHIDSIGLDGDDREHQHVIMNNLKGPRVRLRNLADSDMVAVSDEGSNTIEFIHLRTLPRGFRQDVRKRLPTAANSLSVTLPYVFWSDGRTPRVFWDEYIMETSTPRRVELSMFPNETHLHLQATTDAPNLTNLAHPCTLNPCSHICVQAPRLPILGNFPSTVGPAAYKCLCPPGLIVEGGNCTKIADCKEDESYCYKSNDCIPMVKRCDGKKDCKGGEDEDDCLSSTPDPSSKCFPTQVECNGGCIQANEVCPQENKEASTPAFYCEFDQFKCRDTKICLEREQVCDKNQDCPDGSDEGPLCHTLRCLDTEFMCVSGNCILGSWRCDGDADCTDGSDEANCANQTCNVGSYQCRSGQCVEIQRRCDGQPDCVDGSDEERCQEPIPDEAVTLPNCDDGELPCELNKTICLPATAWCNNQDDCPGGTDEHGCTACAAHGLFECKQEQRCLSMRWVCNHNKDCIDGSDETPDACELVNRTSRVFLPVPYPPAECHHGFLCKTGQCIEWNEVCDQTPDCFDGSDENGLCFTACENTTCTDGCQATPIGPQCTCKPGFELRPDRQSCGDVDECLQEPCSQHCVNFPGSFLCSCRHGFKLRPDRRSCKSSIRASKSIIFASGFSVSSISEFDTIEVVFEDSSLGNIADIDVNFAQHKIYVTSPIAGKLIEVTSPQGSHANGSSRIDISNIGRPTKVAADWISGNVYFVDNSNEPSIKVCNFQKNRCARVKTLPPDGTVTSLQVSPENRKLYYSVNYQQTTCEVSSCDLGGWSHQVTALPGPSVDLAVDGPVLFAASLQNLWVVEPGRSYHSKDIREWPLLYPQNILVLEDHMYVLSANRIYRCITFGAKTCIPFIYRMPPTQAFIIRHPIIQRPLVNECEDFVCDNICVVGRDRPRCVCENGEVSADGKCALLEQSAVPLFNGVTSQAFINHSYVSATVIISITFVLFLLYLAIFIWYYHFYRPRHEEQSLPVRFQNQTSFSGSLETPTVELPTASGSGREFANPLQFARNLLQGSYKRNRPIGTAGLSFDIPRPKEDLSDTESDIDYKDGKNLI